MPKSFHTPCEPTASTAYTWPEDFESYEGLTTVTATTPNNLPDCWSYINECTYNSVYQVYPVIYNASSSSYSSPNHLRFYSSYSSWTDYDPQDQYAILPPMSDLAGKEIKFMARGGNTSSVFNVGIMTDPMDKNTFTALNATAIAPTTSYEEYSFMIPADVDAQYVAIMMEAANSTTTSRTLYVDNISVKEVITVTADKIVRRVNDPETEMTWDQFAGHVNNDDNFTHETITLMSDLMIGTMVGTSDYPFTGTFDGNGHTLEVELTATDSEGTAPFYSIKNANIMNLTVTGTINMNMNGYGAGFAANCKGTNTFTNCVSDVEINSTEEGNAYFGGFIANNYNGANTTFNGCAFTGSFTGDNISTCSGFCANNNGTLLFNNCVVAPYSATVLETGSATFASPNSTTYVTLNNCYYTQAIGTAQGKQMLEIYADPESAIEIAMVGEHTDYSESEIQAYATGMVYASKIYAGEGETVTLNLTGSVGGYGATSGTLTASGENFTLTMAEDETMIYEISCPTPYNVNASEEDATSAKIAWNGNSDSYKVFYREVITAPVNQNLTYDFEDGTMQGWTTISNDNDANGWAIQSGSSYAHNSSYCVRARFTSSSVGGDANDWLISPQITLGGTFGFYAKRYKTTYTDQFQVYVSTTGNDIADFTAISEVITPNATYDYYEYDLSSYSGQGYVAIVYTAPNDQYYVYVDDITYTNTIAGVYGNWMYETSTTSPKVLENLTPETTYQVQVTGFCSDIETDYSELIEFTTLASCLAPSDLTVTEGSVTTNEAELTWTKNGNATAWQICLNDVEEDLIEVGLTDVTIEESLVTYPLTGLSAASHYSVKVRSNCGGVDGVSAWSNDETIDTQCDVIIVDAENDYEQDFTTWVPNCWSLGEDVYGGNGSQNWRLSSEAAYSGYYGPIYLYMPTLNIVGDHASLTFESKETSPTYYTGGTSGNHDGLSIVKVSTDNGTTWTQLWCPTIDELTTDWRPVTINLDGFIDQNILIAFEYQGTNAHGWNVDNVKVALVSEYYSPYIEPYETNRGGYYLIASPIAEDFTPSVDNGFVTDPGSYDLYYFDQAAYDGQEWINFKDEYDGGFDIVNGKGYLYASEDGTILKFRGTPYEGSGEMLLEMTDDATVDFQGWNLVGNPFAVEAYVNKPYYRMNPEGRAELIPIVSTDEAVEYMEGIFVKAEEDGEVLNFTTTPADKKAFLALNLNKGSKVIDRSIVTFGNDERLPKFQLNGKSSKIYLPVEGKNFAIANAESNMGEMPVSFKAETNGNYTLSFNAEEVSFAYLHLIDNMNGNDVDLLETPSYSFVAKTTDYANRFKLVFATGNNSDEDNFAFFSNGSFVINNEGNATLQVIDVNGRILKSESINGCANVNVNAAPGVYMIRLVNGENVKVQKVVVR